MRAATYRRLPRANPKLECDRPTGADTICGGSVKVVRTDVRDEVATRYLKCQSCGETHHERDLLRPR